MPDAGRGTGAPAGRPQRFFSAMQNADAIWRLVEAKQQGFFDLSDRVWNTPELNYQDIAPAPNMPRCSSARAFASPAASRACRPPSWGSSVKAAPWSRSSASSTPCRASARKPGLAEKRPLAEGGNGHGCGHNLLGAGSLLAATAVKDWLAANRLSGRVRYYGCPAEEGGSGKGFMVRAGLFDDVDVAISWHPAAFAGVNNPISLACNEVDFHFSGRASHAAMAPHLGRSALDAVELMNVGINYLREHMPSTARIHYAVTDAGGIAPNVVQARATVRYLVRSRELSELHALLARVYRVAEGAALMTETSVVVKS